MLTKLKELNKEYKVIAPRYKTLTSKIEQMIILAIEFLLFSENLQIKKFRDDNNNIKFTIDEIFCMQVKKESLRIRIDNEIINIYSIKIFSLLDNIWQSQVHDNKDHSLRIFSYYK